MLLLRASLLNVAGFICSTFLLSDSGSPAAVDIPRCMLLPASLLLEPVLLLLVLYSCCCLLSYCCGRSCYCCHTCCCSLLAYRLFLATNFACIKWCCLHSCCCRPPFSSWCLNVVTLPGIVDVPGNVGIPADAFVPALAGVPAVALAPCCWWHPSWSWQSYFNCCLYSLHTVLYNETYSIRLSSYRTTTVIFSYYQSIWMSSIGLAILESIGYRTIGSRPLIYRTILMEKYVPLSRQKELGLCSLLVHQPVSAAFTPIRSSFFLWLYGISHRIIFARLWRKDLSNLFKPPHLVRIAYFVNGRSKMSLSMKFTNISDPCYIQRGPHTPILP